MSAKAGSPANRASSTGRASQATTRPVLSWLPILAVALIGIGLAPRLFDFARHSWQAAAFPWQLDYDEGVNANASWLLSQGHDIYRPNAPDHFVSALYPPLYFALNAVAMKIWGLNLLSGRLVSLCSAFLAAGAIWAWVYAETRRHLAGELAALIWLALGPVFTWSTFYKQDMAAIALGLLGGAMASCTPQGNPSNQNSKSKIQNRLLYWSVLPLALSFWMKQSSVAPMAAVGLFLLLRDRQLALRWCLVAAGSIVLPFAALDIATSGGLHAHMLAFSEFGQSLSRLGDNIKMLWSYHVPLVLSAAAFLAYALTVWIRDRRTPSLSVVYLVVAIPATVVALLHPTGNYNHLLNILAPLCLVAGVAFGTCWNGMERTASERADWAWLTAGVLLLAFTQAWMSYTPEAVWYPAAAAPVAERQLGMDRLSQVVRQAQGDVFSEDDWLLLKSGKPVLYDDPAAMAALARSGAWDQSVFLQDLEQRKFALVVTEFDLTGVSYNPRWSNEALQALQANYEVRYHDVLQLYIPRAPAAQPETVVDCSSVGGPMLAGYTFRAKSANPGDNPQLSLYWGSTIKTGQDANVKFFVRLVDAGGAARWQADLRPGEVAGKPWPSGWQSGQLLRDDLAVSVAESMPPGSYSLQLGTYSLGPTGEIAHLSMSCSQAPARPDGTINLGQLQVVSRWDK